MVSIIIVHYNTFDLTFACVASCYKHIVSDFEIILVDNGSSEKSLDELLTTFQRVKYVDAGGNIGFAKGNNLGIQAAKGEYILLLNSDCELTEDSITPSINYLKTHNEIGVLTCSLSFADGVKQNNFQSFPSIAGDLLEATRLFKLMNKEKFAAKYENRLLDSSKNRYCDWVWGAFFLFRKTDLLQLQKKQLSDRFFMYGEDMEWCWQFAELGKKTFYFAETVVVHHMGQSNFGSNNKKWRTIIRNEIQTVRYFKGNFYTFFFRVIRALKYLFSPNRSLAKFYLQP